MLPALGNLDPMDLARDDENPVRLKRKSSASAEQSNGKRQFVRNGYEEIADIAIREFGLDLFGCWNFLPSKFVYEYIGRDRNFKPGPVSLVVRSQMDPSSYDSNRKFILTIRMTDSKGPFDIWPLMIENQVPHIYKIRCGQTPSAIKSEISAIVYTWLDFLSAYYTL